jgi:hypothetical protein
MEERCITRAESGGKNGIHAITMIALSLLHIMLTSFHRVTVITIVLPLSL